VCNNIQAMFNKLESSVRPFSASLRTFFSKTFKNEQTNGLVYTNVILLHFNHRYVSATDVAIFRIRITRI
jgi:hypothetical protein